MPLMQQSNWCAWALQMSVIVSRCVAGGRDSNNRPLAQCEVSFTCNKRFMYPRCQWMAAVRQLQWTASANERGCARKQGKNVQIHSFLLLQLRLKVDYITHYAYIYENFYLQRRIEVTGQLHSSSVLSLEGESGILGVPRRLSDFTLYCVLVVLFA